MEEYDIGNGFVVRPYKRTVSIVRKSEPKAKPLRNYFAGYAYQVPDKEGTL